MTLIRTKQDAIKLFGGTMKAVGDALGISRQAVWQWPEELPQEISDRLVGAAIRHGILPIKSGGDREGDKPSSPDLWPPKECLDLPDKGTATVPHPESGMNRSHWNYFHKTGEE